MSDIFPEDTMKIIGCQVAIVLVPIGLILIVIGVAIGWLVWA